MRWFFRHRDRGEPQKLLWNFFPVVALPDVMYGCHVNRLPQVKMASPSEIYENYGVSGNTWKSSSHFLKSRFCFVENATGEKERDRSRG